MAGDQSRPSQAGDLGQDVTVAIVTGASADVLAILHQGHEILFTPAGILTLKHTFIGGAVVSVIGLFTKSPLTPTPPASK